LFLEAVLWRGLPVGFGNWNSAFQRFRRWAQKGDSKGGLTSKIVALVA